MNRFLVGIGALALIGCTDADRAKITNWSQQGRVTCYAGNEVVFDDISTGVVAKHSDSDGFYFVSSSTKRQTEVSGMCVVDYGYVAPPQWRAIRHQ